MKGKLNISAYTYSTKIEEEKKNFLLGLHLGKLSQMKSKCLREIYPQPLV